MKIASSKSLHLRLNSKLFLRFSCRLIGNLIERVKVIISFRIIVLRVFNFFKKEVEDKIPILGEVLMYILSNIEK